MKTLSLSLVCLFATVCFAGEIHQFGWQEGRSKETGEKEFYFGLSNHDLTPLVDANERDYKAVQKLEKGLPADTFMFVVMLKGEHDLYQSDRISLAAMNGHEIVEIRSGFVKVDRKKDILTISLKTGSVGEGRDFIGNGVYPIKHKKSAPNRTAEPASPSRAGLPKR